MENHMNDDTTEYPIATDGLRKGDRVSVNAIERAFSVKRQTDAYRLALLKASNYIVRRFRDRGEIVTVVERKHDLVILTDDEASKYNDERFAINIRGAARAHTRNLGVDRSKLSAGVIDEHDRRIVNNGRVLGAIRNERASIAIGHRRTTPLPPGAKSK